MNRRIKKKLKKREGFKKWSNWKYHKIVKTITNGLTDEDEPYVIWLEFSKKCMKTHKHVYRARVFKNCYPTSMCAPGMSR